MTIIKRVSNWIEIRDYLKLIESQASPEQARCARGRMNLWLNYEPNYSKGTVSPTINNTRVWNLVKHIYPECDLAQVYYSTNMKGIAPHSDWRHFASEAYILNLGNGILTINDKQYNLTGGEIIQFDCKQRHSFQALDEDRVGIGMWKLNPYVEKPFRW